MDNGGGGGMGIVGMLIYLAVLVLILVSMWKLYVKMGQPGWAAIVPIYNYYVLTQALNKPILWFILMLVPGVNSIVGLILMWELVKCFGKSAGFFVGCLLLSPIFLPMLAFSDATFTAPPPAPAA